MPGLKAATIDAGRQSLRWARLLQQNGIVSTARSTRGEMDRFDTRPGRHACLASRKWTTSVARGRPVRGVPEVGQAGGSLWHTVQVSRAGGEATTRKAWTTALRSTVRDFVIFVLDSFVRQCTVRSRSPSESYPSLHAPAGDEDAFRQRRRRGAHEDSPSGFRRLGRAGSACCYGDEDVGRAETEGVDGGSLGHGSEWEGLRLFDHVDISLQWQIKIDPFTEIP